jgi:DNA-binding NarL/FixJ family response regulator
MCSCYNLYKSATLAFIVGHDVILPVVDDNPVIRSAVKQLFEDEFGSEVTGEAKQGAEAVEQAITLQPHLVILDFAMPVMNGLLAAPILLERLPEVFIIMLTLLPAIRWKLRHVSWRPRTSIQKQRGYAFDPTVRALSAKDPAEP